MHSVEESVYVCPSFNSYSSDRLPEVAAKISDEFKRERFEEEDHGNDEFEFSPAEEFFYDAESVPVFPVFNRDLRLIGDSSDRGRVRDENQIDGSICIALEKLSIRCVDEKGDREPSPSSSSSEAEELESVDRPVAYCMWRPRSKETRSSPSRCEKSSSTGSTSTKRWKIRDLLRRSNSEGKDGFVLITPKNGGNSVGKESGKVLKLTGKPNAKKMTAGDKAVAPPSPSMAAHEKFYVRSRAAKERVKRKSYLPYRQELVGLFASVNALGRSY